MDGKHELLDGRTVHLIRDREDDAGRRFYDFSAEHCSIVVDDIEATEIARAILRDQKPDGLEPVTGNLADILADVMLQLSNYASTILAMQRNPQTLDIPYLFRLCAIVQNAVGSLADRTVMQLPPLREYGPVVQATSGGIFTAVPVDEIEPVIQLLIDGSPGEATVRLQTLVDARRFPPTIGTPEEAKAVDMSMTLDEAEQIDWEEENARR